MSLPAIAALLRASSFPTVANAGARFFEGMTALLAAGPQAALDAELLAILDEDGVAVFPAGTATTEAAALLIFERRTQFVEEFGTSVSRFIVDGAVEGGGLSELRVRITAAELRAFGAVTTAVIALGDQLAKASVRRAYVLNLGLEATGLTTLLSMVGHAGDDNSLLVDATVFAADAVNETIPVAPVTSYTADTALLLELTAGANFSLLDAGILDPTEVLEVVIEMSA